MESNISENEFEISQLCRVKTILEQLITNQNTKKEIFEMYENISSYIDKNCNHVLTNDYIDISLEKCKSITYCEICLKTF